MQSIFHFCVVILLLLPYLALSQFGPPQQIFDTGGNETYLFDIDGDNALDVLHITNDFVYWFKNLDGEGTFGNAQLIFADTNIESVNRALYAGDIDGDDDLDIVYGSAGPNDQLAWFENTDGLGDFGPPQTIQENRIFSSAVLEDLDADNDLDLIYSSSGFDRIAWHENMNGLGDFSQEIVITNNADFVSMIDTFDINNDNDNDIISVSDLDNKLAWYENTNSQGSFGPQQVISNTNPEPMAVFTKDIDADGNIDVIVGSDEEVQVSWYKNLDGQGTFGPQQFISNTAGYTNRVCAADIDRDGDIDVLSTSIDISETPAVIKVSWYENLDGQGTFGPALDISIDQGGGVFIDIGDIDGDGDIDVIATGSTGIFWFENLTPLGVEDNTIILLKISPNPAKDLLYITSQEPIKSIHCFDVIGNYVVLPRENKQLDVSQLASGIYILTIETATGMMHKKFSKR